ncbi:DNA-binding LacI/PurR family transcriptional regulator [Allocatelliglobosispora scoriae]|uniref:DNA-binding LacI/PurR family transcriptional regulator n=1 Tax=Allocatelliglobosispora scoriae TaxID=643052 RepID=A0A841C5U0_9ACTN|nr:LacI family DNA-binding transcriptional regulator [Allocatelliglobosispora scoriae]MBB5874310.1 DNA-binding LacI/PurR family transcriptional regulator [Allocatelliglobosispora scoriae]
MRGAGLSHAESDEPTADGERAGGGPAGPVTISYIAESAGVSVPTVSKVLNGRSGVAADTRARVEALVSQFGYRKSTSANRSTMLELVFDELQHLWGIEIIRGVERVAREHRMGVVLTEFGPQRSAIRYWIDDTLARRPACIVTVAQLSPEQRNQLRSRGIPFVVVDPTAELPDDVPFVGATNWTGGRSAARHLIELGHRRIAMISGPDRILCCQARLDGYRSAMAAAGLPADLVVRTDLTREDGHAAALTLLTGPDRPTAIFAGNDLQALGVYQAARALGLRIPADLSVVGFDDLPIAALVEPPLTTVHQPLTEMAVAATELALALGRGERTPQIGLELATTLTVRGSTAPPPS